jgi:hypothetical protein
MAEEFSGIGSGVTSALMVIAVIAVVISAISVITIIVKQDAISGYTFQESGNATIIIEGVASINFTHYLINWSNGGVNSSAPGCGGGVASLSTEAPHLLCTYGWLNVTKGLVIENNGNTNVNITLRSTQDATSFIGGPSAIFQWKLNQIATDDYGLTDGETGSCVSGLLAAWTNVALTDTVVCSNLTSVDSADELEVDLRLNISTGAVLGSKVDVITATAISVA